MLDFNLIAFISFILVIALLILKDRKKVKMQGIVFIRRTKKGRQTIDKTANKHKSFFTKLSILGIIVAIPLMVIGALFLMNNSYMILSGQTEEGGVKLLLPGPVDQPVNAPGVFIVPWWIWVIGVSIVMVPHEFMHGIVCRLYKIRIKSVGWLLLLFIPGAFVEPDEKQLQKAKRSVKMKVYAAGSFANIMVGLIVVIISSVIFALLFSPSGLYVIPLENTPANYSGLSGSIIELNGEKIMSINDLSNALEKYNPGDVVDVKTARDNEMILLLNSFTPGPVIASKLENITNYHIKLTERDGKAFLGVSILSTTFSSGVDVNLYSQFSLLLIWIYVFSIGIGIVNLLPIKPLDGGLIFEEIVSKYTKKTKIIVKGVSIFVLLLLVFNLVGPIFL